ncbi:MAG TPA: TIR domain-containing protein [Solirubrobacteraceae bacterium]|jgi:predicted nucleotide-binding protein|nr:TIR domain-containing protein [Solirubrobacteraceae bacterium]
MLEVSVPIAYELLAQCVKQGQALVQRASLVGDFSDYESWKAARSQWIGPTVQALEHMYGDPAQAREFADGATCPEGSKRWQEQYGADLKCVKQAIDFLTELQGELAFENGSSPPASGELAASSATLGTGEEDRSPDPGEADAPQSRGDLAGDVVELHERDAEARQERSSESMPISEQGPVSRREGELYREHAQEPEAEHDGADAQPLPAARSEESRADAELRPEESRADAELLRDRARVGAELAHTQPQAQQIGAELAQQAQPAAPAERELHEAPATARTREVYLAHGRDEKWKQAVEHLLEQAGEHEIKIVNRRASERARLTEELREDAPGSHYAVVLLTADDIGGARLESDAEPYFSTRAHQEVVFEMGFLVAALSPGRVCVLYEDGVELPCDLDGVSHVRLDLAGTWQPKLLLHLRRAGFDYDMNKLAAA